VAQIRKLVYDKVPNHQALFGVRLFFLRMKKGMPTKNHLDELNKILMHLKNINVRIDEENLTLILLCSLSPSFESFVNSMLYSRVTLSLKDVKSVLHSEELRHKVLVVRSEDQAEGLFIRNRIKNGREKFRSNFKLRKNIQYHYCRKFGHFKEIVLSSKEKKRRY